MLRNFSPKKGKIYVYNLVGELAMIASTSKTEVLLCFSKDFLSMPLLP